MRGAYRQGKLYDPDIKVAHNVPEYRTEFRWLVEVAFWQGHSKRAVESYVPKSTEGELDFLEHLHTNATSTHVRDNFSSAVDREYDTVYIALSLLRISRFWLHVRHRLVLGVTEQSKTLVCLVAHLLVRAFRLLGRHTSMVSILMYQPRNFGKCGN